MILAGDIGGTKTKLALAAREDQGFSLTQVRSYPSQEHAGLGEIIDLYLKDTGTSADTIDRVCVGVAGPVLRGEAKVTNLPWRVREADLRQQLGTPRVRLLNDLEAFAYSVPVLGERDLVTLQAGLPDAQGAKAILAPGTGLGVAYLVWDGLQHRACASEGGHADFAPADPLQERLWAHLHKQYGHVSWERALSGPGLYNVYRFLRSESGPEPEWLAARLASEDPSAAVSAAALQHEDPVCERALELFVAVMGAAAGNLALTFLATGGVYLGGGIPPKILPRLQDEVFVRAFQSKGRLSEFVKRAPVYVINNPQAPLLGAAACAAGLA